MIGAGANRFRTPGLSALAALSLGIAVHHAHAEDASLLLCDADRVPDAAHRVSIVQDGGNLVLALVPGGDRRASRECLARATVAPAGRVVWLGAASSARWLPERALTVVWQPGSRRAGTVEFPDAAGAEAPRILAPGADVLPARTTRSVGAADRLRIMSEGSSVALSCAAGDAPAGVMLELNGTPAAGARLGLDLLLRGDAGFSARLVTSADGKPSEATALPAGPSSQVRLALPLAGQLALAVSCPNGAGRLEIVRGRVVSAGSALTEPPAAWVWNQHLWQHEAGRVRDWARRWSVATLFISVPVEAGAVRDVARLAEFIRDARAHGIAVFAVEGDPDMISGEGRGHALVRARAIADYQAAHPTARLAGLQYDIEPYVAPGFAADAATAWRQWGETLRSLSAVYGAKVDAVVPFWMLESPGGSDALATAAPVLEQLTVMAYRTDTTEITSAAAPLLSWAVEREIPVTIALEAAPLLPDLRETFEPADIGELHAYRIGQFVAFVLLDRPGAADGARVYRRRHVVPTKPERLTFAGHPGRLASTLETLANGLSAWPSALRVALHGLADSELSPAQDQIPMETRK